MHILGAQHILGSNYKASKFNKDILNGNITFEELERRNSIVFNDITSRFLNFSNLYHVLTNSTMIYFDKKKYNNNKNGKKDSLMDFKYILYENINNKKVHAGLDTFNKGFTFYCKSLLVKSLLNDAIIKDQEIAKIKNIKVIDLKSKLVILDKNIGVEREVAVALVDTNKVIK